MIRTAGRFVKKKQGLPSKVQGKFSDAAENRAEKRELSAAVLCRNIAEILKKSEKKLAISLSVWYDKKVVKRQTKVGIDCGEGTPVPIPNTEVKLTCADDTWLVTARNNK